MNVSTAILRVMPSGPNVTSTAERGRAIEKVVSSRPRSSRYMCVSKSRGSPACTIWRTTCGRSSKRKSTLRNASSSSHLAGSSVWLALRGRWPASRSSHSAPLPRLKTARIGFSNGSRVRETKPTAGMSGGRFRNVPIPETRASKTPSRSRSTSSTRVSFEKLTFRFSKRPTRPLGRGALVLAVSRSGGRGVGIGVGAAVGRFGAAVGGTSPSASAGPRLGRERRGQGARAEKERLACGGSFGSAKMVPELGRAMGSVR